jgi:spore germination protein
MEHPRQVTVVGAAMVLTSTIIGVGVLPLPRFASIAAGTGGPLVTLAGALLATFGLWLITVLGQWFPEKSIFHYSEDLIGRWPGRLGSVLLILFFAILSALAAREFGEVVVTAVLKKTPLEVIVIVMLLLAAISSRNDIATFSYMHQFYLPFILAPGLLIAFFSLKNADPLYLQPIWGNQPPGFGKGVLTIAALFQGSFIMSILIPSMRRPEKAMRASLSGMAVASGFYLLTVVATIAVFGPEETKQLLWPTLELARMTSLPANVLERLDAIFLIIWVTAVFTTLLSSYYLTIHAAGNLLRLRDHKMFAFFLLPFVFLMSMSIPNVLDLYVVIRIVGQTGLILTVIYPLLLFVTASVQKWRRTL